MVSCEERDCCGCSACVNVCPVGVINLVENERGFLVPRIEMDKCIHCEKCSMTCPTINFRDKQNPLEQKNEKEVYALKIKSKRMKSQSGGAFTAFAEYIIRTGGVIYGVLFNGQRATYTRVTKLKELSELKGSKYIQSEMTDCFIKVRDDLQNNKIVLFSGTSCHIDGLLSYMKMKNIKTDNLFTCDLICHGVPSPKVFRDYMTYLNIKFDNIKAFNFRNKILSGWKGHVESFQCSNSIIASRNFVNIFYSNLALRENCYYCHYASLNRITDITISDFWGIENVDIEFNDDRGISMVMVNSQKGNNLLNSIQDKVYLRKYITKMEWQPNLHHPTEKKEEYDQFWKCYTSQGFKKAVEQYCNFNDNDFIEIKKNKVDMMEHWCECKNWIKGRKELLNGKKKV